MENNFNTAAVRRLYKSRRNKIIDGICGGIAEYFDVDPTIVRLLWILITLLGGSGIILYIIAMIIMPVNPEHNGLNLSSQPSSSATSDKRRFWGILLILIGALILITNLGWFAAFRWWSISWGTIFPIILIGVGILLVFVHLNRRTHQTQTISQEDTMPQQESTLPPLSQRKELHKSPKGKKLFGVCSGLANYFDIDPTIIRIIFVILVLASFGWGLLIYILLAILMPEEKLPSTSKVRS